MMVFGLHLAGENASYLASWSEKLACCLTDLCSCWVSENTGYFASWPKCFWTTILLTVVIQAWRKSCRSSDRSFGFDRSQSLQMDLNSINVISFNLDLKVLRTHFSAKVWAFSESEWSSLNVESWRLNVSILSVKCSTRLFVMFWGHLLLIRSICCAGDAVGHAGFTNVLRSDNLALKSFVTVP